MLHKDSFIISPATFKLLHELQVLPALSGFHLVGGTSLALQLGHRNSVDIDLFTQNFFNGKVLAESLENYFQVRADVTIDGTLLSMIKDVKVDFILHNHPY